MNSSAGNESTSTYDLLLIFPVALSALWILVELFYASWLLAFIANFVINAFLPKGTGLHIGRLKISLLAGRVIFKDLRYYDRDNSIFITDGYGILRWWKKAPVVNDSTVSCKRCGSDTKGGAGKDSSLIYLQLNGVEYHWYNRKDVYDEWGKPKTDENEAEGSGGLSWIKPLHPSVHCTINKGRILLGNHLMERTLVVYFQHAEGQYRMTEASNSYDELMHLIRWHGDKVRAVLEPSAGYNGAHVDVPLCAEVTGNDGSNGYLLLKTDSVEGVYSLDIPGLVPLDDTTSPKFAFDVFLGCNSVINYGSYANRQRINLIQKFFFPNDYTVTPVTRIPQPGERRIYTSFDVSVHVVNNATLNLFFEEQKEIRCLTFRIGGDSSVTINQPWITRDNGYTTTLKGRATNIEVLTSLPYEHLGMCQTFNLSTNLYFPRVWNATQKWDMNFGLTQIQGNILFQYIDFFNALIDDWLGDAPPDLLEFIPVDWNVGVDLSDYEIYLYTSSYNWIDITTEGKENSRVAFCGKTGHLAFEFPFTQFLPLEQPVNFTAHGQNIVIRKYLPPSSSTRDSHYQLASSCKERWRIMDPPPDRTPLPETKLLRSVSQPLEPLQDIVHGSIAEPHPLSGDTQRADSFKRTHIRRGSEPALSKRQIHNIPLREMGGMGLLLEEPEEETHFNEKMSKPPAPVPDKEAGLNEFFPMGYRSETQYEEGWLDIGCGPDLTIKISYHGHSYDPAYLPDHAHSPEGSEEEKRLVPNEVSVEVEASSVLLRVFGSLVKDLVALKDNFVSEYMYFKTYFSESTSAPEGSREGGVALDLTMPPDLTAGPNVPKERFLNVTVDFKLHNIMGELPAHAPSDHTPSDFPLVSGMSELFSIRVNYTEAETWVWLHIDPVTVNLPSLCSSKAGDYGLGYLALSGVDLRCHGFTEFLLMERVEYAWMMSLELGDIRGTVSAQQLLPVIDFFTTAANHVLSYGDDFLKAPDAVEIVPKADPLSEALKYSLFAVNLSSVDVNIREKDSLLQLKSPGFNLDLCNLHHTSQTLVVSLQLHHLTVTAFTGTPTHPNTLMECGRIDVGRVRGDIGVREAGQAMSKRQLEFLKRADAHTHRLWFLWQPEYGCGCVGGCQFQSSSINRKPLPQSHHTPRDLPRVTTPHGNGTKETTPTSILAKPSQHSFKSLKTLQYVHATLVTRHYTTEEQVPRPQRGVSLEETPVHLPSTSSLPSLAVLPEDARSQESDDSFISAKDYFEEDDPFQSTQTTPKGSVRHSRQPSIQTDGPRPDPSAKTGTSPAVPLEPDMVPKYGQLLNSYRCTWKSMRLYRRAGSKESPPIDSKRGSGLFGRSATPKRKRGEELRGPRFLLEVPTIMSSVGSLPYILRSGHQLEHGPSPSDTSETAATEESAMFSVEVGVAGFDILLTPPLVRVIDRYIECAGKFFGSRSAHFLLEGVALEGLGSVESHLKKAKTTTPTVTTPTIPSSPLAPLAHLSISMDPSAHGSIQLLQMNKITGPISGGLEGAESVEYDYRRSVLCLYTTGFQGNALIHHNNVKVYSAGDADNLQMTLKIAGKFCLPVLQAGLFSINYGLEKGETPVGITSNYSFLDFTVEPSANSKDVSLTNIAELSMNKFVMTTAAKIIQSEFSSKPILTWADIPDGATPPRDHGNKRDSEQTNNSLAVSISVPSVRLQLGGPKHGIPSDNDLCVDLSLLYGLVEAWRPLVENTVTSAKSCWRDKIRRDRLLLMCLVTAAMDTAYRQKASNPLLTALSGRLRESVAYSVVQQLWRGLPMATDDRLAQFPSDYQQGFILQEIIATLIGLGLRLYVQRSSLSSLPCVGGASHPSMYSSDPSAPGYFSISPSASELAMGEESFGKIARENIDYLALVRAADTNCLLYIRECLLPLFSACNIKITPQLSKQCHNSLKLNMDYNITLEEAAILVMDGRDEESQFDSVDDSVGVVPEFLLDHLSITGSLEHVTESRIVTRPSGYLVTVRSSSHQRKSHRSNVTAKCCLGLDAIATHITLPLLMLSRHNSHSLRHWRRGLSKPRPQDVPHPQDVPCPRQYDQPDSNKKDTIEDVTLSHSWNTAKSLVGILGAMEKHKTTPTSPPLTSQSKQATPKGTRHAPNLPSSPPYPLSVKALGAISRNYGLEEPDSIPKRRRRLSDDSISSNDSPNKLVIRATPTGHTHPGQGGVISSGSHGLEGTEDTTDSPQVLSSDTEAPVQASMATYTKKAPPTKTTPIINPVDFIPELSPVLDVPNMNEILAIPDDQLEFSVCGLVRVKSLQVSSQIGSLLAMLEVRNISGAVDCRQIPAASGEEGNAPPVASPDAVPFLYTLLPTYLSLSSTLQQCCVRVFDSAVSQGDLAVFSANPLELCTSLYYSHAHQAPAYRSLFRLPRVELDIREPPIILHKKFHKYIPTFTAIFNEILAPPTNSTPDDKLFVGATPSSVSVSDLHFPPHLPRGSFLFHLVWFRLMIKPLSSLTVTYQLAPVTAQLGTSSVVRFSMNVGQHNLEFKPKESKDELSLRNIPLPAIALKGSVVPRPSSRLPSISAELAMKQVVVDVTTDVFNQLLLLQTSFIKELNDLINMFFNIGEALPQEKLSSINFKQSTESGFELISLLSSIKLSLQGIKVTVSTPTQTALRFSTGNRIEMLITNPSHQLVGNHPPDTGNPLPIDQLTLHGKVETEISVSLGCLQDDTGADEEDDFIELAYFKTWVTVKNTLQQNTSLLTEMGEGPSAYPASLDTFLISIMAPHLYIQSTAVEKAILFWINCKSVYNFWQNEHKLLNAEVQAATEEFVGRITKPSTQMKAPSFDFSKPRLVQITVSDVGACMPLVALPTTPHSSQKGFPALVFTVKDMQVTLNLSKRLSSAGKFSEFCVRFDERFHFRHKTWTVDPRKHKFLNYGEVPNGTYRFCIVNKPREDVGGGEKVFSAFTWHMSGINTHSTTRIGRHISTLVRTLTAIGSDLEDSQHHHDTSGSGSVVQPSPPLPRHRRYSHSFMEEQDVLRALEVDLAKQTRKLQKLRQSGANPDSLKSEEDNFHKLEVDIARGLRRVFRRGRGMTFQQWGQLLYPWSPVPQAHAKKRYGTLPRRRMVTFEDSEMTPDPVAISYHPLSHAHSPRTHARHCSDITPDVRRLMKREELETVATPSTKSLEAVLEDTELYEVGVVKSKGDHTPKGAESLIPSIDIEVNVTINVDNGQIVLVSEDTSHDHNKSFPNLSGESPTVGGARRSKQATPPVHTVLFIPAVEVKAHYQTILGSAHSTGPPSPVKQPTENVAREQQEAGLLNVPRLLTETDDRTRGGLPIKRGVFTMVTTISSLPNDLELDPTLLDYIEQVVRPINISAQEIETADIDSDEDKQLLSDSELPLDSKSVDPHPLSFPVDICLNFQICPSKIILTCNPHARVRCQLAIPVLSFVVSFSLFSKKHYDPLPLLDTASPQKNESDRHKNESDRHKNESDRHKNESDRHKNESDRHKNESDQHKNKSDRHKNESDRYNTPSAPSQSPPDSSLNSSSNNPGPNSTDEVSIINNINVTGCLQTFQLTMFTPNIPSSLIHNTATQQEDKEVISLVLGQAFIHLSRSSLFTTERAPCSSVDDYKTTEKLKISIIPHIESLILFYDWRRLNDITWFRKCWYHTGLMEALFMGRKPSEEPSAMPHPSSPYRLGEHPLPWSPGSPLEDSSTEPSIVDKSDTITAEIVVAVSIADTRLSANVAQLMGNAYIQVSHLNGHAHADIKDNELVFLDVDGTLEELEIDAQGGVVAGNLRVKDTIISMASSSQVGCIPEHNASGSVSSIEGHIDYMSGIILLVKGTGFNIKLWDSWVGVNQDHGGHSAAKIQVCCKFDWSTCQISIHRATAKGMFGIVQRIYDFVVQQKKRSERMIGSMIPAKTTASTLFAAYLADQKRAEKTRAAETGNPLLEHHHWVWAVRVGSIKLMNALGIKISPDHHDVSLGGFINVSGDTTSVVCFHGTSFREKEWVVFNIDMISAKFSTLAIPGLGGLFQPDDTSDHGVASESSRRICQQVCIVELGNETSKLIELAALYRVMAGRGGVPPVSPKEISDWLNYVCINHYLNSVHTSASKSVGYMKESQKLSIQPICSLPACSFKLINDHLWPSLRQLEQQIMDGRMESATVECTLVTRFSDGIAVSTTVDNYLFLHDLFTAYIDYLDKQNVSFRPPFTTTMPAQAPPTPIVGTDQQKVSNCLRKFVCVHWELEPRVVLLATAQWASGHFNPHITWVLETLGFKHARTTIPKCIQRGLMDPLDLGIASIVELLVELSATKKLRTLMEENSI